MQLRSLHKASHDQAMRLIQVDIVGLQALQRTFNGLHDLKSIERCFSKANRGRKPPWPGPAILVAITTWERFLVFSHFPTIVSESPAYSGFGGTG